MPKKKVKDLFPDLDWQDNPEVEPQAANDNSPYRAIVYGRHSKTLEDGRNAQSSQRQAVFCKMYCASKGYEVVEVCVDESISGMTTEERPGWERAMKLLLKRRGRILVVTDPSRLSRELSTIIRDIDKLIAAGVEIHVVGQGSVPRDLLLAAIISAGAAAQLIRSSTTLALHARAEEGKFVGVAPYGYLNDPNERGAVVQIPEEVATIRMIIAEVLRRGTAVGLARDLNQAGCFFRDGKPWTTGNLVGTPEVPGMLRNMLKVGLFVFGRKKTIRCQDTGRSIKVKKPPSEWSISEIPNARIISDEENDRLQACLTVRRAFKKRRGRRHFLSGLIRCPCGGSLISLGNSNGSREVAIVCRTAFDNAGCERVRRVSRTKIERVILAEILRLLSDPAYQAKAEAEFRRDVESRRGLLVKSRKAAEAEVRKLGRQIENVMKAIRNGGVSKRMGNVDVDKLDAKQEKARTRAESVGYELEDLAEVISPLERVRQGLADVEDLLAEDHPELSPSVHAALAALIETVVVDIDEARGMAKVTVKGTVKIRMVVPLLRKGRPAGVRPVESMLVTAAA